MSKKKEIIRKIDPEKIKVTICYEDSSEEFTEADLERINSVFAKTAKDDYLIRVMQSYFEIFLRTDEF